MSRSQNDFIYNLIAQKLSGNISETDNDKLLDWINSSTESKEKYKDLEIFWSRIHFTYSNLKSISQEEMRDRIWKKAF